MLSINIHKPHQKNSIKWTVFFPYYIVLSLNLIIYMIRKRDSHTDTFYHVQALLSIIHLTLLLTSCKADSRNRDCQHDWICRTSVYQIVPSWITVWEKKNNINHINARTWFYAKQSSDNLSVKRSARMADILSQLPDEGPIVVARGAGFSMFGVLYNKTILSSWGINWNSLHAFGANWAQNRVAILRSRRIRCIERIFHWFFSRNDHRKLYEFNLN